MTEKKTDKPELELVIWPSESLRFPVQPFPHKELGSRLVKDTAGAMIKAMYKYHGVGLAAQQVGVPFAVFVMDPDWHGEDTKKHPRVFLNPQIVNIGDKAIQIPYPGEGCLSFPYGYRSPVRRRNEVELQWFDFKGEMHREWFDGHAAIVIQHEIDHLMGFCFIDRLSGLKRDVAIRKARKVRRQYRNGYKNTLKKLKTVHRTREYQIKRQKAFEAGVRAGKEAAE